MTQGSPKDVNKGNASKEVVLPKGVNNVITNKEGEEVKKIRIFIADWSFIVEQHYTSASPLKKLSWYLVVLMISSRLIVIRRQRSPRKIESPPGFTLVKFLEFFCCKKTVEYVIQPMHAEYLVEYYEALNVGRKKKAALIKFQMRFFLVTSVISSKLLSMLGQCIQAAFKAKTGK